MYLKSTRLTTAPAWMQDKQPADDHLYPSKYQQHPDKDSHENQHHHYQFESYGQKSFAQKMQDSLHDIMADSIRVWIVFFTGLLLCFVYMYLLVEEESRISDDTCLLCAFFCVVLLLISALVIQYQSKHEHAQPKYFREQERRGSYRPYSKDRNLLNQNIEFSIRQSLVQEEQRRALLMKQNDQIGHMVSQPGSRESLGQTYPTEKELHDRQRTPIVGLEDNFFSQPRTAHQHRVQEQAQTALLQYYKEFDCKDNDIKAAKYLKLQFNTQLHNIQQFSNRTQVFVLKHLFKNLMDKYEEAYFSVVSFANDELLICFKPESEHHDDLIDAVRQILYNQRCYSGQSTAYNRMKPFLKAVLTQNSFGSLSRASFEKLQKLCQQLKDVQDILASVCLTSQYYGKELYAIKRIYTMTKSEENFKENGFLDSERPNFEGKLWSPGYLPSDPEIVSATFCALIESKSKQKRVNLFDSNLTQRMVNAFDATDISLVNRQPRANFRAHFEVIVGKKAITCPSGSMNLWYALMVIYAAIYKLHKGVYRNIDYRQAIRLIFNNDQFQTNLDRLDFA